MYIAKRPTEKAQAWPYKLKFTQSGAHAKLASLSNSCSQETLCANHRLLISGNDKRIIRFRSVLMHNY